MAAPRIAEVEYVHDDRRCKNCHEGQAISLHPAISCEQCHGPGSSHLVVLKKDQGSSLNFRKMTPAQASEICLQCHEQDPCEAGACWRTSAHAHHGVACTNCHRSHQVESQQPNMGAVTPQVCYGCHPQRQQMQQVAHPHQICGAAEFDCSTCHDPHGRVRPETRSELCLDCHRGTPTIAWHSSTHHLQGVACADCHNPHPEMTVPRIVDIQHNSVGRANRLPMSVDEPFVCIKCHAGVSAKTALPSHHPIREGKMTCSDCHDGHGQATGNLTEVSVNLVCYKCHAEKQGPFVWQHPPVEENCNICHEPHGTVANQLLHEPTTFLCLRCHAGHRGTPRNLESDPSLRAAYYTDCAQCHPQIHGSDLPAVSKTPRFLR